MKLKSGFESKRARIEMVPLIDVMFTLLIFFIYAFLSMAVHRGVDVELPGATAAVSTQNDYVDISITEDNSIFVNKQPVSLEGAAAAVRAACGGQKLPVFINGDRRAGLGLAVELLDRLRLDGIEKVSFACTAKTK
jgi:biopolymer transport protein ExbD